MADATFERRLSLPARSFDRSSVVAWVISHREVLALASIMAIAGLLRLYQLDVKALHHDESLHADFTYLLYKGKGYHHDPLMHGPFLFESGAVSFFLFGATDFTARLMQAIFGTMLVGMPYLLRKQIGMKAVFIAAILITISPTLLYVSRFDRHDIFIVFWMMSMTVCVWRYLDERKDGWLYAFAAVTALSFATMEVTFINVAILLVFIDVMLAIELGKARPDEDIDGGVAALRILAIAPIAWAIAAMWPLLGKRKPFGRDRLPPIGDLLVVLGTLALPQYSAGIQALPFVGDRGYEVAAEVPLRNATMITLVAATVLVGFYWRPKTWFVAAAWFYIPWVLLYTTFFTNIHGIFSGGWGALDYWLDQQDVARGGQPWYYYSLLTPLYEYLPLVLAIGGGWWVAARGTALKRWFVFWLLAIFLGLSLAGEKMPWLEVHIALPLCLVASIALAGALDGLQFTGRRWQQGVIVAVLTGASTLLLVTGPGLVGYIGAVGLLGLVGWAAVSLARDGRQAAGRVALTVVVAALFTLTVRTSLIMSFEHADVPVEMLVYTQTSPEIPEIAHRIDAVAKASGQGYNLPISVDGADSFAWPWAWYLRNYHDVLYIDTHAQGYQVRKGDIVLLNKVDLASFDVSGYTQTPYKHRWWFIESYKDLTWGKLGSILTSPSSLKDLGHFFLYRHPEQGNTGSVDAVALFPTSLSQFDTAKPTEKPAPPPVRLIDGRILVGRSGTGPGELQQPDDVFVDRQGNVWVADGKNNRIVKYDQQGNYLGALGPFAAAPQALNEPWSVAVDEQGIIYVADTWNHRIVKFSPSFQFLQSWGEPATKPNPGPLELFGPRDIKFAEDGTLLVTDTGNQRIINFSKNGDPIAVYGSAGSAGGEFNEPVSLARDGAGRIYVADAWNGRIQRFQSGFVSPDLFATGWTSHDVIAKPYIAVLADGRLVASDPGNNALILLDTNGNKVGTWKPSDGAIPLGVAATADGGFIFSDANPSKEHLEIVPGAILATLFR